MSNRALHFTSTAAMPDGLRKLCEAQGKGAARENSTKPEAKPNKYGNQPVTVDGIRFPSKKEARYYEHLKLRQHAGDILYFLRQVAIQLPDGTKYIADFMVVENEHSAPEFIDTKGKETPVFRLKKKAVEFHFPIKIRCV